MNYTNQSLENLIALFEINEGKINQYKKDKNAPIFVQGVINKLIVDNLELLKIINKKRDILTNK